MNPTPFLDAIVPFRTITTRDIPPDALTVARQCILDWLGCALAGSAEPLSNILRAELLRDEALRQEVENLQKSPHVARPNGVP